MTEVKSARIIVEVVAGVIPGMPEDEWTRKYVIDSDTYYATTDKEKQVIIAEVAGKAYGYAALLLNPNRFNWVRVDWIYL